MSDQTARPYPDPTTHAQTVADLAGVTPAELADLGGMPAPTYLAPVQELDRLRTANEALKEGCAELNTDVHRLETALEQAEARVDFLSDELALTRAILTEERRQHERRSAALNRTGASNDTMRATLAEIERLADKWNNDCGTPALGGRCVCYAADTIIATLMHATDQEPA